jgi:hypothetical protein
MSNNPDSAAPLRHIPIDDSTIENTKILQILGKIGEPRDSSTNGSNCSAIETRKNNNEP